MPNINQSFQPSLPSRNFGFQVRALANSTAVEILVYGAIGESWDAQSVSARDLVSDIRSLPDAVTEIVLRINSDGGSVADGLAIYSVLKEHPARKRVVVDGVAASIASAIAMAGDSVQMAPTALMMIHAPWSITLGNAEELRRSADVLDIYAGAMAKTYAVKSGKPEAHWLELIADGVDHWFTADEAVAAGLADAVLDTSIANESLAPAMPPAFARRLERFIPRAPARIAASLRTLFEKERTLMPEAQNQDRDAILAAERSRVAGLRSLVVTAKRLNPEMVAAYDRMFDEAMADSNQTSESLGFRVLQVMGANATPLGGGASPSTEHLFAGITAAGARSDGPSDFINAASDALLIRSGIRVAKPHAAVRDVQGMSLVDMANACLSRAGRGHDFRGSTGAVQAAMSTSDFPLLLSNALGKVLRTGYEAEPRTYEVWTRLVLVPDFKPQTRSILGSAPDLLRVLELGEYQEGAYDEEGSLPYSVGKFGRLISLSWEALRNDDLGAFLRVSQGLGQAAARAEADSVYATFALNSEAGPAMQDGVNLFHATHANLAASSVKLDAAALASARVLLRRQKAIGGGVLNLTPRFLVVAPEHESEAETLLAAAARGAVTGSNNDLTAAWMAQLQLVVEPRLTDSSIYVLTSPDTIDTFERAHLEGEPVPAVLEADAFDTDAHRWKCRHTFGGRWLDWRGAVKVPISG